MRAKDPLRKVPALPETTGSVESVLAASAAQGRLRDRTLPRPTRFVKLLCWGGYGLRIQFGLDIINSPHKGLARLVGSGRLSLQVAFGFVQV